MMYVLSCMFVQYVLYLLIILFFFFKQKTAYEMRISDWSSDVCSSDLAILIRGQNGIGRDINYLVDIPLDSRGRTPKLKKQHVQIGRASCRERVCQYV